MTLMEATTPITDLRSHIASLAKRDPKKIALIACDQEGKVMNEISYQELSQKIDAAAEYLHEAGLLKGDRVALAFKNSPELLILSWAAWSSGIVTVPLDTKRDTGELYAYKIQKNEAAVLIAQSGVLENIDATYLKDVAVKEFTGFPPAGKAHANFESGLSHLALILFTSGTTGYPKGAKLSLQNLIVNADSIREWLQIKDNDRFIVELPLHHINSTTFCLSVLLAGGTIIIPPSYSNSHFWQQVARTGATCTSIVQSILFDQTGREKEFTLVKDDVKLTKIQIGSAPVVVHTMQEFMEKYKIPLYQGYGQTETALRVTGVPMGLSGQLYTQLVEENSIGSPMSWAEVEIADENGRILGEGEDGELIVRGSAVMDGYIGDEPAFRDGYFLTGDVGQFRVIDGTRYFSLKGRKRELIIKGGINISPVAVENHLKKISHDIDQVHVVAVSDERYGEEIGAVICWKKDADEARAKRRLKLDLLFGTQYLSAYETPKYLTSLTPEELPMTSTGKVQRSVLKTTLPYGRFESIFGLLKMKDKRFTILHRYSRWASPSYDLYKQCWGELSPSREKYEKDIQKHLIVLAADAEDRLLGQIAIVRTNLSAQELCKITYDQLLTPDVTNQAGNALVCISICSAEYREKPIPHVTQTPSAAEVRTYIDAGHDPVMRFHSKPKGGQKEGAELIGLIPGGRPEDKSSLGYNMLLKYPPPSGSVAVTESAPVSEQLIEMALLIAHDLGIEHVYAFSRPGGLASYMSKEVR